MASANISHLGDHIAGLSLHDARDLSQYLADVHGIEPAAAVVLDPDTRRDPEPVKHPDTFDVALTSYGNDKLAVIRLVRTLTDLSLRDAKRAVEGVPFTLRETVDKAEAERLKSQIESAGGTAELS